MLRAGDRIGCGPRWIILRRAGGQARTELAEKVKERIPRLAGLHGLQRNRAWRRIGLPAGGERQPRKRRAPSRLASWVSIAQAGDARGQPRRKPPIHRRNPINPCSKANYLAGNRRFVKVIGDTPLL